MKHILFIFILNIFSLTSYACSCLSPPMIESYQAADFVARIKINKVIPDPTNSENHLLSIEILELFKGDSTNKIILHSWLNSSCAFMVNAQTEWILFAHKNPKNELTFGMCNNYFEINRILSSKDSIENQRLFLNYTNSLNRKLTMLRLIKSKQINPTNEYRLNFFIPKEFQEQLRGYSLPVASVALYKISVNTDLTIHSVKAIQPFLNKKLKKKMEQLIVQEIKIKNRNTTLTELPNTTELILGFYYYGQEGTNQSFISNFDL